MREGSKTQPLVSSAVPEQLLADRDPTLSIVISQQPDRWPMRPTEDPVWGLLRIVMAQQISTRVACRLAERVKSAHPYITTPSPILPIDASTLRAMGLSERRAQCCVTILRQSVEIRTKVQ